MDDGSFTVSSKKKTSTRKPRDYASKTTWIDQLYERNVARINANRGPNRAEEKEDSEWNHSAPFYKMSFCPQFPSTQVLRYRVYFRRSSNHPNGIIVSVNDPMNIGRQSTWLYFSFQLTHGRSISLLSTVLRYPPAPLFVISSYCVP